MRRGRPVGRQPFHAQKGGQRQKTIRELKDLVDISAGGDFNGLFEVFMKTAPHVIDGNRSLTPWEVLIRDSQQTGRLLQGIQVLIGQSSDYKKRQFISILRHAGLSRDFLDRKGIHVGEKGSLTQGLFSGFPPHQR